MRNLICFFIICVLLVFSSCSFYQDNNHDNESSPDFSASIFSSIQDESKETNISEAKEKSYLYFEHPAINIQKIDPEKLSFRDRTMGETTIMMNTADINTITDLLDQLRISIIEADKSDYSYSKPLYSVSYYAKSDDSEPEYIINLAPSSVDIGSVQGTAYKSENTEEIESKLLKTVAAAQENLNQEVNDQ